MGEATVNNIAGVMIYKVELTGGEAVHLRELIVRDVANVPWKAAVLRRLDKVVEDFVRR